VDVDAVDDASHTVHHCGAAQASAAGLSPRLAPAPSFAACRDDGDEGHRVRAAILHHHLAHERIAFEEVLMC
jgi:hypothetical protein